MTIHLGGIHTGTFAALPGTEGLVTLADNGAGHSVTINPSAWSTVNFGGGTSLYTGIPLISNIKYTVHWANTGVLASGFTHTNYLASPNVPVGPYMGGLAPLSGQMFLSILKGIATVTFDLGPIGATPGIVQSPTALGIPIRVTNGPWVTGAVPVTGITTNVVSVNGVTGAPITLRLTANQHPPVLSTGGGYVSTGGGLPLEYHTLTLQGANDLLSASRDGTMTLVSPMRIDTTVAISGRVAGATYLDLSFVPEPGTMLLLLTGAIGMAVVGHRRLRK